MATNTVAVVIPVYNVESYLEQCLDSIITQTHTNLEIIIVDDGSTDRSGHICDDYAKKDSRIKVIHQQNEGLSAARNTGIRRATSEYITFVDSDDWIESTMIETLIHDLLHGHSDISVIGRFLEYGNRTIDDSNGVFAAMTPEACLKQMLYANGIDNSACGKLYKTKAFSSITFPYGKEFEDTETTYKLVMESQQISLHSVPLYHYRKTSPQSITHGPFSLRKMDLINQAQNITKEIARKYPTLEKACSRFLMHAYLSILARALDAKNHNKKIISQLYTYIKKYRKNVIKDINAPKSDKIALCCTFFGYKTYYLVWKLIYTRKERE